MKLETLLSRITALIVYACDPEAILLFGSCAKGQNNLDSDLDLLVISDLQESPYLRGQEIQDLLWRYPIRIDLHLATPAEVATASRCPHDFLGSIISSARVVYQKGIDNPGI
jgi:predicted nucleotidyltransferase